MTLAPETLVKHELIGLSARVVDASNPDLIGIDGRIVDETMRTLSIERGRGRAATVATVPKAGATIEFRLPASQTPNADTDADYEYATVDGRRLIARPARRTETAGESTWQSV
ncbi:MAG: ribonuclease P protein component 1 [Halobacteriales archaeon]|nr:ribonuclease P protein component 1 [Halobacteriales archaeon]